MSRDSVFVIALKDLAEREFWGFSELSQVAIVIPVGGPLQKWELTDWHKIEPPLFKERCVVVYSDDGLRGGQAASKSKLYKLVGDSVRVWDHAGEFDLKVSLDVVHRRFDKKGFKDAGFTNADPVMPFSVGTGFPWMNIFNRVRAGISQAAKEPKEKTPDAKQLLGDLEAAWNTAVCFFTVDQPAKCLLESLFPLYVDLKNHQVERVAEADLCASIKAAKEELEFRLAQLGQPLEAQAQSHVESLKIRFGVIKDSPECDPQKQAKPGWELLGDLESLSATQGIQEFILKFTLFSEAYSASLGLGIETGSAQPKAPTPPA